MMARLAMAQRTDAEAEAAVSTLTLAGHACICDPFGALYCEALDLLVVSDLHLEKGAAFARRGWLMPPYDTYATLLLLEKVIARYDPVLVISLGDNFHDREGSRLMPQDCRALIASMAAGRDWLWITGNHDPDGVEGLPGTVTETLALSGLVFRHEPSPGPAPGEIAGHLHPVATVRRREKSVRRPCFATDGARLLMPSFGVTTGGLDLGHPAFRGLFDRERLVAHLIGRDRVYPVLASRLKE